MRGTMRKVLRWTAAWIALVALMGVARAQYDARQGELNDQLQKQATDPAELALLQQAVGDWLKARNESLKDLLGYLDETSPSQDAQERRWTDRLGYTRGDLAKMIGD